MRLPRRPAQSSTYAAMMSERCTAAYRAPNTYQACCTTFRLLDLCSGPISCRSSALPVVLGGHQMLGGSLVWVILPLIASLSLPAADQLPSALRLSEEQWQQQYRFPKPRPHDPVIMQCRTNRRAAWAAQLAQDAGLHNCLVYRQVVTLSVSPTSQDSMHACPSADGTGAHWLHIMAGCSSCLLSGFIPCDHCVALHNAR